MLNKTKQTYACLFIRTAIPHPTAAFFVIWRVFCVIRTWGGVRCRFLSMPCTLTITDVPIGLVGYPCAY